MGGIIRAGRELHRQSEVNPVAFNLADVKQQGEEYLRQVRQQAQQIIAQAQQEAAQIREQSRRSGEADALKAATENLEQAVSVQMHQLGPSLAAEFDRLAKRRDEWIHEWEQQAIKLSVRIAERVIQREVESKPDIPVSLVHEALEVVAGAQRCEIRLHPQDYDLLQSQLEEVTRGPARLMEVTTRPDPQVTRGGCEIHTDQGEIDQRLESRLQRIEAELLAD